MGQRETILIKAGEKLKQLRTAKGLSVHKAAKAVHISGTYLSELERGIKEPSDTVIEALAQFYEVPMADLFGTYERIAPEEANLLLKNPSFRKTIVEMSMDKRLTKDEHDHISSELNKLYRKLIESRKD